MNSFTHSEELLQMAKDAVKASRKLMTFGTAKKNRCLEAMAQAILNKSDEIKEANALDIQEAKNNGLSSAMVDRLLLNDDRIDAMAKGLNDLVGLNDPVGKIESDFFRPNGLQIQKIRVPIGVIGIIYESRPNVTVDSFGLCLKAGNAVILRGGKEAINSNRKLAEILQESGLEAGLPKGAVQLIPWTDRQAVQVLLKMDQYINLIIPRGGESLIRAVTEQSTIPVIKHYKGVCHAYVDKDADFEMALDIIDNGKRQRPGVCNALETVLIHNKIAPQFLAQLNERIDDVEIRGDETTCQWIERAIPATEEDWDAEYLNLTLAVRVVEDFDAAVDHIADYSSGHSDAIISNDKQTQKDFQLQVDSAAVYVNASTRFTDGAMFGMGAEIGISTDRLHARGPMGLEELTTYKYIVNGTGQIRE